jgi:hypothetical protein
MDSDSPDKSAAPELFRTPMHLNRRPAQLCWSVESHCYTHGETEEPSSASLSRHQRVSLLYMLGDVPHGRGLLGTDLAQ